MEELGYQGCTKLTVLNQSTICTQQLRPFTPKNHQESFNTVLLCQNRTEGRQEPHRFACVGGRAAKLFVYLIFECYPVLAKEKSQSRIFFFFFHARS
jgi:hypothetical protein